MQQSNSSAKAFFKAHTQNNKTGKKKKTGKIDEILNTQLFFFLYRPCKKDVHKSVGFSMADDEKCGTGELTWQFQIGMRKDRNETKQKYNP